MNQFSRKVGERKREAVSIKILGRPLTTSLGWQATLLPLALRRAPHPLVLALGGVFCE